MFHLFLLTLALSLGQLQCIDSSDYWYDISKDLKLARTINNKQIHSKLTISNNYYLAKSTQKRLVFNKIDCPFTNGTHIKQAQILEFHCSFYKDVACKQRLADLIISFEIEPTNNKEVTLLRKAKIAIETLYDSSIHYLDSANPFFNSPYLDIPFLLLLAQKINTPYVLTYVMDPSNENLRSPILIEMPTWQKSKEYYDVYHNIGYFSFNPSDRKLFAHEPIIFSPEYTKAMGLEPKSKLYANFHRVGVNRLISYYNLK